MRAGSVEETADPLPSGDLDTGIGRVRKRPERVFLDRKAAASRSRASGGRNGTHYWASATRLTENLTIALWRSAYTPVWNHHIDRATLLWDSTSGVAEETLAALKQVRSDRVRLPAPTLDELRTHLDEELTVSPRALRDATRACEDRLWSPGKPEPVADSLWRARTATVTCSMPCTARERTVRIALLLRSCLASHLKTAFASTKHSHAADSAGLLILADLSHSHVSGRSYRFQD